MKYTLIPDSRRPVYLVCEEDGQPVECPDGRYKSRWPFNYEPSPEEKELRAAIARQFPDYEIMGISPTPTTARFEARKEKRTQCKHTSPSTE